MFTRREFLLTFGALGLHAASCRSSHIKPTGGKLIHPGFPYHPLVYHLDLATLAYQLYGQSLVFPFDPYYEEMGHSKEGRAAFIKKVKKWIAQNAATQQKKHSALHAFRGPGVLGNFPNNPSHDPILYRYDLLYPWSDNITHPEKRWLIYQTPKDITQRIHSVYVAYRKTGGKTGQAVIEQLPFTSVKRQVAKGASDVLLCFEGGTGDKGESGQPHSQSLMGFVLLRKKSANGYDIHISFRGSRSGDAGRAFKQAFSTKKAQGNPDWITDLGWFQIPSEKGSSAITSLGKVHRGFVRSVESIFPQLLACLKKVDALTGKVAPQNIYVTGHSLGGGLAQQFVSAILLGSKYGPGGAGPDMPKALAQWPWKQIKLITFSAPRAGDALWAKTLTEKHLQSKFWSHPIKPTDDKALKVSDPSIVQRLLRTDRPAAYRVLISNDPITSGKIGGGKHVGQTVYADNRGNPMPDFASHEVVGVRKFMYLTLADKRIPLKSWAYASREQLHKELTSKQRATEREFQARVAIIKKYYSEHSITFDSQALDQGLQLFLSLMK